MRNNHVVVEGINDFQTLYPLLAAEWDDEQNYPLRPTQVSCRSTEKYWWKCKLGHSWQASLKYRLRRSRNCPYCSNNKVWPGFNNLATTHPHLANEWDGEKMVA